MYIIKNDIRNAFKTYDGWTTIVRTKEGVSLVGLNDVIRFTTNEMLANRDKLGKGCRFVYFPKVRWSDLT